MIAPPRCPTCDEPMQEEYEVGVGRGYRCLACPPEEYIEDEEELELFKELTEDPK